MIKAGDLVGWSEHFRGERPGLDELDDCGIVVSIYKKIRIAWFKDPDEAIDEYPISWAKEEMRKGGLSILSRP
jgi:hypothetical protein